MGSYSHNLLEINQNSETHIYPLIEPETKYRFRYASEGGSHGGLAGKKDKKDKKKTYPTVELRNYNGSSDEIFIRVSLCTEKKTDHVLQFKGKKSSEYMSYVDADLDGNFSAVFKDLTILIPKKEDVHQALLNRRIKSHGRNLSKSAREKFEKDHKEDIKKEAKEIFNSVVLKFDALEYARPDVQICPSYYSKPICNQKDSSKGELKICRMSKVSGSCKGEEEVILLCEKVQKDNVKIKFFEKDENDNRWEAYASFSPSDVHYQVAIAFKTPPYKANREKRVAVCLERGGEMSEPRYFTYIPEDCPSKKRKKCMKEETIQNMPSPMEDSSSSSSTGALPDTAGYFENLDLQEFSIPNFSSGAESPPSDSSSSSQQDLDNPSKALDPYTRNVWDSDLLTYLMNDSIGVDAINQSYLECDGILNQNLQWKGEMNQSFDWDANVNQSLSWDDGMNQSSRPKGLVEGQMALPMMDAGKLTGLMAVMDIKYSESDGKIPLKVSMKESKSKILTDEEKKLKQCLPYIANTDGDGNTLLHLAVLYNKSIKRILQLNKMSNCDIINVQNNNKQTALHIAVENNSAAIKELLQNSANPSIKNAKGDTCCHVACQHDFVRCLEYILYPRRRHTLILNDFNYEGLTPVHVALKHNSLSCLDFLFSARIQRYYLIDFTAVDSRLGQTFLHNAVQYSPSYVSRILNEEDIKVNCKDFDGNTPLHIACAEGNAEVVRQLIEAGADPGMRNSKHNHSNSDEENSADEASLGLLPADLTADPNILNLLRSEDPSDVCLSVSNEDEESARIFEKLSGSLSNLLDPGMRWKELAVYVLDEEYVTSLEKCNQNPTKAILEYMKKTSGKEYIEQLKVLLSMVGFNDAVEVTDEICKA